MGRKKTKAEKLRILNFDSWFYVFVFQFLVILVLYGCSSVVSPYYVSKKQMFPYDANVSDAYYQTELKKSGAHNVLPVIQKPDSELLSQSRSVVASLGQSSDGYKTWFNMVAFDELKLTARRKYFFLMDEKVKRLPDGSKRFWVASRQGLMFDCQMVIEKVLLNRPYSSESAKQIATLRKVLKNFRRDIDELCHSSDVFNSDNKKLAVSGLLINQVFEAILFTLDTSPVQAAMLGEGRGFEFDHINLGKGKIQMTVEDDIVTVKIRLGVFIRMFDNQGQELAGENQVYRIKE